MAQKLWIETERLLIRNLHTNDLSSFLLYRSDPEVTKYQGFDVMNEEQALAFIQEHKDKYFGEPGEWVQYAIENKATKKLIGDCAIKLQEENARIAEIGITLSPLHQQKGFAKEAVTALLDWLFTHHKIHRIVETVDAENQASIRLLKSIGFRQEGHFIENIWFKGKWGSEYQFALLHHEWKNKKPL